MAALEKDMDALAKKQALENLKRSEAHDGALVDVEEKYEVGRKDEREGGKSGEGGR